MDILIVNGSPRLDGNTSLLSQELTKLARERGHSCKSFDLVRHKDKDCIHCEKCYELGRCVFESDVYVESKKADCIIICSPLYFFGFNSIAKTYIDKLYSIDLSYKLLGAVVVSGSEFFDGGSDLAVQTLRRTCQYCKALWMGSVHKFTQDEKLEVTPLDVENLNLLLDSLEGQDTTRRSVFIRD